MCYKQWIEEGSREPLFLPSFLWPSLSRPPILSNIIRRKCCQAQDMSSLRRNAEFSSNDADQESVAEPYTKGWYEERILQRSSNGV